MTGDNTVLEDFKMKVVFLESQRSLLTDRELDFIDDMAAAIRAREDAKDLGIERSWEPTVRQMNYVSAIYQEYQ